MQSEKYTPMSSHPSAPEKLYRIERKSVWDQDVPYKGGPNDLQDGFLHLSTKEQITGTLEAHFQCETELLLLQIDSAALGAGLKWEPSRAGELFPHFYGIFPKEAVKAIARLRRTPMGWHTDDQTT